MQKGLYSRDRDKVKLAGDEVDQGTSNGRHSRDLMGGRMRTADDDHHAIGHVDGKRRVTQLHPG